ncbi:MAG: homoserine O-acetyltransferase [Pseudomonadota bacterium]
MTSDLCSAGTISPDTRLWRDQEPFDCESGAILDQLQLAYRTWGELNDAGDNAVLVCHALTGSADADGWWPGLIGPGLPLDTDRDFVICSNVLGGCYGSSGPMQPDVDGKRLGARFPVITIRDMVRAQRRLLEHLEVKRLSLVIGPSMGGMQVLEWAMHAPDIVDAIAPIGVSARHSAWCISIGESQRATIEADPAWLDGHYEVSAPPRKGLAAARMMAMVTYRSWDNFESRFARHPDEQYQFTAASYLRYQGSKLTERFYAVSYVRLTQAMDSHDVGRDRDSCESVLAATKLPALVVSVTSDVLYPPQEQQFLAEHLGNAFLVELDSPHGHDGFLIDLDPLGESIRDFRAGLSLSDAGKKPNALSA